MAKLELTTPVYIAISIMIVAVVIPIAIGMISDIGNYVVNSTSGATLSDVADPAVITLLGTLLPIIVVIGLIIGYLKYVR